MENCHQVVPKAKLKNMEDIRKDFSKVTNKKIQSIITSNFVWSAHDDNCKEKAIMCTSTSFFYAAQDNCPTHIMDVLYVPISGKPACEAETKRQTRMLIKSTSKMFPSFCDGQRRKCGTCKNIITKKNEYNKCFQCITNVPNAWWSSVAVEIANVHTDQFIRNTASYRPVLYFVIGFCYILQVLYAYVVYYTSYPHI